MCVNHGRTDIGVPKQVLNGADVIARFEEVCRKGVAKGMRGCRLGDIRSAHCPLHCALERLIGEVMSPLDPTARIDGASRGREYILPAPFTRCTGIFTVQREWKPDGAEAVCEIPAMQFTHVIELFPQRRHQAKRQHRHAILVPLAIANEYLPPRELYVLHSKTHRLHDAKARSVQQSADQAVNAR